MATISRRPTTEKRRTSIESDASSSGQSHRLSNEELKTLQNDSTRHLLERMDEMQIEKAMEGLKVVKERRKSSITKKKKKSDNSSNNGNNDNRHNNSNKKEAASATSLDINIAAAAASLNEHGEKSRRSGKGNSSSSSRGKSPNNVARSEEKSNDAVPPLPLTRRKKQVTSKSIQKDGPRRMSKSVGGMVEEHDFSQYVSDSDSNEDDDDGKNQAAPRDYNNNGGKKNAHNAEHRESFKKT